MAKNEVVEEVEETVEKKERTSYRDRCTELEREVLSLNYEIKLRDAEIARLRELNDIYRSGFSPREASIESTFDRQGTSYKMPIQPAPMPLNQTVVDDDDDQEDRVPF